MLGKREVQLEPSQAEAADQARHEQHGEHRRYDQEQQVVGRGYCGCGNQRDGQREEESAAGDAVFHAALERLKPGTHGRGLYLL